MAGWDVERIKLKLSQIVKDRHINSAKRKSDVDEAWKLISSADDQ